MDARFKYDAFLSSSRDDLPAMKELRDMLEQCGLRAYLADEKSRTTETPGPNHVDEVLKTLDDCRHLVAFASSKSFHSTWVNTECRYFFQRCHQADPASRGMFALSTSASQDEFVPRMIHASTLRSVADVVSVLVNDAMKRLRGRLQNEETRVKEAFETYDYSRLWRPQWGRKNGIHIFTCARDLTIDEARTMDKTEGDPDPAQKEQGTSRQRGGRTNIDIWDFQTVLDLTRFFGSRYPNVNVTIEDPVSKLSARQITKPTTLANKMTEMQGKLKNRDCVIVGSPDVSDFAEIAWAELHKMDPYAMTRVKERGFVIIKGQRQSSSVYWGKKDGEAEGVARIENGEVKTTYKTESEDGFETTYGVLVVANNPFDDPGHKSRILILSGFTGVATNGIAKLIADRKFYRQFFLLDQAFVDRDMEFEALVSTRYRYSDRDIDARDARIIDTSESAIRFRDIVPITKE